MKDNPGRVSAAPRSERLFSLDVLRGLDIFLLTAGVAGLLLFAGQEVGLGDWCSRHIGRHADWVGFTLWDIIMPLFIFMSGAAIPFALGRRRDQGAKVYWTHVAGRVALLWFCGMCAQGRLFSYDIMKISPYNNTLQTIAVGYLVAAAVQWCRRRWLAPLTAILLAVAYALLLHFGGDYSKEGNFAYLVEIKVLGWIVPAGSQALNGHGYTWFLTSLMFGAMSLCGMMSTEILLSSRSPWSKAGSLAAYGATLLVIGFGTELWIPSIKHIFTLSFTAQAMGYSVLSLAVLYVVTDIWRFRKGLGVFVLFGQNALFAYMITHFYGRFPNAIADCFYSGFAHFFTPDTWKWIFPVFKSVFHIAVMICLVRYWALLRKARKVTA